MIFTGVTPLTTSTCSPLEQCRPANPTRFNVLLPGEAGREELEDYIADKYRLVHRANVNAFLPILLRASRDDATLGAVGIRPGQFRPMFLEQYLESPIEQQIAGFTQKPVDRLRLVEIGNLSVTRRGFTTPLFVSLVTLLAEAGFEWVVFTATAQVEGLVSCIGFDLEFLAMADPGRLVDGRDNWGDYYASGPRVLAGNLDKARQAIAGNRRVAAIAEAHREELRELLPVVAEYRRQRSA